MVEILDFCEENLSDYEKNMLRLMIIYGECGAIKPFDKDIENLAMLLKIEISKIKKALTMTEDHSIFPDTKIRFGDEMMTIGDTLDYVFIDIILRFVFISKNLGGITYGNEEKDLINNIELFEYVVHDFEMINAHSSTFECMFEGFYTLEYAIYSNSDFSPMSIIRLLKHMASYEDYYETRKNILPIMFHLLWYELYTRTNALYLICVVQVIKHAKLLDKRIQSIAVELYEYLLFLLRNARIVFVQVNSLYQDLDKQYELRTKADDNTTRLSVLYGYDNDDAYYIRLDLSHQGQGFVHYNNISPGGIKSCLFNEEEYLAIVEENPDTSEFFIRYGNRYALKELTNLCLGTEEKKQYELIKKTKEHDPVLKIVYSEESIEAFIDYVANMLPSYCYVPIDKEGSHATHCFRYSKLMSEMYAITCLYFYGETEHLNKLIDRIVETAVGRGYLEQSEREIYKSLEGIGLLIEIIKEKSIVSE